MTPRRLSLPALAVLFVGACMTLGHDFWLEPSSHRVAPGDRVDVAIMIGHHDDLDSFPRRPGHAKSFRLVGPSGHHEIAGEDGDDPAGSLTAPEDGAYWIVYHGNPSFIELDAKKFEEYLKHEGLGHIIEERARLGESDEPGLEAYSRCAKAAIRVGASSTPAHAEFLRTPVGLPLELIPLDDPFTLRAGDDLAVRLLHRGEPLADAMIEAMHRRDDQQTPRTAWVLTNERGEAMIRFDHPGRWVLANTHMVRKTVSSATDAESAGGSAAEPTSEADRADWESHWATLAIEIAPR
ncbi:MAG: DUF4198 domain-containing protein [Planctomycetota bacterium]